MGPDSELHVLCFGGQDWWYHNRAHADIQLMRQFARYGAGAKVLYVNSIVMRKFNLGEGRMFRVRLGRKLRSMARGLAEVEPGLFAYSPVALPVHHLPLADRLNQVGLQLQVQWALRSLGMGRPIVWVLNPAACRTALRLPRAALVYQRTDRYEEYPGIDAERIGRLDRTLRREADLTVFTNRVLHQEEADSCRGALLLDHGVDYERFADASSDPRVPVEMRNLPRPIVGFFGGIDDHTSDVALAAEVARLCPEMTFVFIGTASADVTALTARPNVRLLGQRPYEQIPHYGKCFDAAIMPWRQNRWIEACNPIKLKEYLALGKPVVSTPFGELAAYTDVVTVAEGAGAFAASLRRALAEDSDGRRRMRRERVAATTWNAQARQALEAVRGVAFRTSGSCPNR